jgi:hypothetical protein
MGFLSKVTRAVTLWTDASFRRAEVLSEAIFYGIGMAMIGEHSPKDTPRKHTSELTSETRL